MNGRTILLIVFGAILSFALYSYLQFKRFENSERFAKMRDSIMASLESTNPIDDEQVRTKLESPRNSDHCLLYQYYQEDSIWYVEVDFIVLYRGEEAIEYARSKGEAEMTIEDNGDTTYYVYNDYYIANEEKKTEIFEIADDISIWTHEDNFRDDLLSEQDIQSLESRLLNYPFKIQHHAGVIYSLHEEFIP